MREYTVYDHIVCLSSACYRGLQLQVTVVFLTKECLIVEFWLKHNHVTCGMHAYVWLDRNNIQLVSLPSSKVTFPNPQSSSDGAGSFNVIGTETPFASATTSMKILAFKIIRFQLRFQCEGTRLVANPSVLVPGGNRFVDCLSQGCQFVECLPQRCISVDCLSPVAVVFWSQAACLALQTIKFNANRHTCMYHDR